MRQAPSIPCHARFLLTWALYQVALYKAVTASGNGKRYTKSMKQPLKILTLFCLALFTTFLYLSFSDPANNRASYLWQKHVWPGVLWPESFDIALFQKKGSPPSPRLGILKVEDEFKGQNYEAKTYYLYPQGTRLYSLPPSSPNFSVSLYGPPTHINPYTVVYVKDRNEFYIYSYTYDRTYQPRGRGPMDITHIMGPLKGDPKVVLQVN